MFTALDKDISCGMQFNPIQHFFVCWAPLDGLALLFYAALQVA